MRKITFLAAVAATLCTVACNKNMDTQINEVPNPANEERFELKVQVRSGGDLVQTKSTTITPANEVLVNNRQVFVFRGDALDAYGSINDDDEITLSCTGGERQVYALVNCPDLSAISTKTALLATSSLLSGNSGTSFQMIGHQDEVDLPDDSPVTINVHRLAARVVIKKISRAFTVSALAAKSLTIDQIFITNVAGDINFGETASPTVWYNKMAYSSEQAAFTYDAPASALANNASYSTAHSFYAYPNPTVDDAEGGSWSARHTRLVIKVTLGTDVYYYPITLPALEANKSYEIDELILTRPGSDNPDKPVSFQDCTFQVNVVGWTTVPVSDENEDDITI